jgi:hypothetical protein
MKRTISRCGILALIIIFGINIFGCVKNSNINGEWVFENTIVVSDDLNEWYKYYSIFFLYFICFIKSQF